MRQATFLICAFALAAPIAARSQGAALDQAVQINTRSGDAPSILIGAVAVSSATVPAPPNASRKPWATTAAFGWTQVPDTRLKGIVETKAYRQPIRGIVGPKAMISAWNGAVWNEAQQRLDIIAAGGHADYCGNEYSSFDLDDLRWRKIRGASDLAGYDFQNPQTGRAPDGWPASRHTYQQQVYVPTTNKTYLFGGSLCSAAGVGDRLRWSVTPEGEAELLGKDESGYVTLGGHALFDPVTNTIFLVKRGHVYQYDIADTSMVDLTRREADHKWGTSAAIDVRRRTIFAYGHGYAWTFNLDTGKKADVAPEGPMDLQPLVGIGLEYVESLDRYVAWAGGDKLYVIHPTTFRITSIATHGRAPKGNANGVYGRFRYSKKYNVIVVVSRFDENVYILQLGELPTGA